MNFARHCKNIFHCPIPYSSQYAHGYVFAMHMHDKQIHPLTRSKTIELSFPVINVLIKD